MTDRKHFLGLIGSLDVVIKEQKNTVILELAGPIDSEIAEDFAKLCVDFIEQGKKRLVLDFSKVDYIASAGISAVIKTKTQVFQKGGNICLVGLQGKVREVFESAGIMDIFDIYETQKEAFK
jgi:anti-anti-sigma factor